MEETPSPDHCLEEVVLDFTRVRNKLRSYLSYNALGGLFGTADNVPVTNACGFQSCVCPG